MRMWNTAPNISCPICDHEFQISMPPGGVEAGGLWRSCPACQTELVCARVATIIEWQWKPAIETNQE